VIGGVALAILLIIAAAITAISTRKTTLTGQVFIVTQGAENVKMGAVEIVLIEKQQVTDFLRQRQAGIDSERQTRKLSIDVAKREVVAETMQLCRTWREVITENGMGSAGESAKTALDKILTGAVQLNSENLAGITEALEELSAARKVTLISPYSLTYNWNMSDEARRKLDAADAAVKEAQSHAANLGEALDRFPTADDYLSGLLAAVSVARRSMTDADGRFSIACPRRKAFMLYANAQRKIPSEYGTHTEEYYWLVDAITDTGNAQIFLSNNNLWTMP
jgi:hypothetical protein